MAAAKSTKAASTKAAKSAPSPATTDTSAAPLSRAQTIATLPKAPVGAYRHVLDPSKYTPVTIIKSGTLNEHPYRRGQKINVNAATLSALKAQGMV